MRFWAGSKPESVMQTRTETIDRLFLELSQFTQAKTHREISLAGELAIAKRTVGFFASVIKSGEPWTETCQREYDAVFGHPAQQPAGDEP
jgi:hypothetical protein